MQMWPWREATSVAQAGPDPAAAARKEGLIRALVGLAIGTLIFFFWHKTVAYIAFGIAGFTLLASLISPLGLYAAISRGIEKFAGWVGQAIAWILLPILFFLFIMPFGLLWRTGRRDKMERFMEPEKPSYWASRGDADRDPSFYERQF